MGVAAWRVPGRSAALMWNHNNSIIMNGPLTTYLKRGQPFGCIELHRTILSLSRDIQQEDSRTWSVRFVPVQMGGTVGGAPR